MSKKFQRSSTMLPTNMRVTNGLTADNQPAWIREELEESWSEAGVTLGAERSPQVEEELIKINFNELKYIENSDDGLPSGLYAQVEPDLDAIGLPVDENLFHLPAQEPITIALDKLPYIGTLDDFPKSSLPAIFAQRVEPDLEAIGLPFDESYFQGPKQQKSRKLPAPPNISKGLGSNQSNIDIVAIADYLVQTAQFMYYQGDLCYYEAPCWHRLDDHSGLVTLRELLSQSDLNFALSNKPLEHVLQHLKTTPEIQQGGLLSSPPHLLNLADCTIDMRDMRRMMHCAEDHFFSYIDIEYEELFNTAGDTFEAFIHTASDGNPDVRQQVLEIIAIAVSRLETKSFYVICGPSGSGKTQFGRFLTELLGHENVSSLRGMSDFGERFALGGIDKKNLIVCLDLPDSPLPKAAVGMLKQLVGDDPILVEEKYKSPRTTMEKPLLVCAGNHPIRLSNLQNEEALLKRMVIVLFTGVPEPGQEIPQLFKRLIAESGYIMREVCKAYQTLLDNGHHPTRAEVPPCYLPCDGATGRRCIESFLKECCMVDANGEVSTSQLYLTYEAYCNRTHTPAESSVNFSRLLSAVINSTYPDVTSVKRISTGQRGYKRLALTATAQQG